MFKRRKMRFNGEWSLLAGNRVYELNKKLHRNKEFRSDEKFLELTKILEIKNKGTIGGLFRYSAGQNDTSPKYFWSLCSETRSCR